MPRQKVKLTLYAQTHDAHDALSSIFVAVQCRGEGTPAERAMLTDLIAARQCVREALSAHQHVMLCELNKAASAPARDSKPA